MTPELERNPVMHCRTLIALLATFAVCLALVPARAGAESFTFTGTTFRSCWEDTEGFTAPPDLQPIPLPGGTPPGTHFLRLTTGSNSGTVTLNTDGTVTTTSQSTTIRNTTTSRVGVSEVTCNGTWTFDPAALRLETTGQCNFANTIGGANTGTTPLNVSYRLVGTTLVRVEPATPPIETVNVLTGANAPFSYQRLCAVSGTLHLVQ
jgi:hypothetical protein